jgi:putative DNA methylase
MLSDIYPELFSTLLVPKATELVASTYRFDGDKRKAESFFENGLGEAFSAIRQQQHSHYPATVYYAFKQSEVDRSINGLAAVASTGWETMLEGLLGAGFSITGTWPMRSELATRSIGIGTNALASSIVLVCRPRPADARPATRQEFLRALKRELPEALRMLQHGNVAPVDLAQAAIGPGMAIFSRYSRVVESDGKPMRVRVALQLINQTLDEVLTEQEGEYDSDTRWALAWFEQHAHDDGVFGQADVLARAKVTSVAGLAEAGVVASRGGKVRLLRRDELPADWDPLLDHRRTVWEMTQHLIRALDSGGEVAAATLLRRLGAAGETARDLAYRLYTTCERKGWAAEARAYNSLVVAWPQISQRSGEAAEGEQLRLV